MKFLRKILKIVCDVCTYTTGENHSERVNQKYELSDDIVTSSIWIGGPGRCEGLYRGREHSGERQVPSHNPQSSGSHKSTY